MAAGTTRARWASWGPFVLLILAGAVRWIAVGMGVGAQSESSAASQAMGCAWAALVWLAVLLRPRVAKPIEEESPASARSMALAALGGALAFCGPAAGELLRAKRIEPSGLMIALALTPIVIALAGNADQTDSLAGRIWPGLAAAAGLLLVVSQPSLADLRSDVALALAPVLTGCGAALLCADRTKGRWRGPCALAGAAVVFALSPDAAWWHAGPVWPSLAPIAWDGLIALLSLLVLERMGAVRWSAQFALLPLLLLLEGMVLLRSRPVLRESIGLLLLAVASVYLLLPELDEPESGPAFTPR